MSKKLNAVEAIEKYRDLPLISFDVAGGNIDLLSVAFQLSSEFSVPIFISSTPSTIKKYGSYKQMSSVTAAMAEEFQIDYILHLDHAKSLAEVKLALEAGFSSVMYDGSHLALEENIANSKVAKDMARSKNVTIEIELGLIAGKEDEISEDNSSLPSIEEAVQFFQAVEPDLLAIAIGTQHGFYSAEPEIDWNLAKSVTSTIKNNCVHVVHGTTGVPDQDIQKLIDLGYRKFNYATLVRDEFTKAVIEYSNDEIKPHVYLTKAREVLLKKIRLVFQTFYGHKF